MQQPVVSKQLLARGLPVALLTLCGALLLILFAAFQKRLMGVAVTFQPKALVVPVLFGGASGLLIGIWRERWRESTRRLELSEERYRTVADFATDFTYWRLPDNSFRYVAPSCLQVTGYSPEEFQAFPALLDTLVHPEDRTLWEQHLCCDVSRQQPHQRMEMRIVDKQGVTRWISHSCRPIINRQGQFLGIRGSHVDITETKHLEGRVNHLECHDLLTGLINRQLFEDRVDQAINQARRTGASVAVLTLGLDHFKLINDSLGHTAGDTVLTGVAQRLQELFQDHETLCRLGGDVFAVLSQGQHKGDAVIKAQQLLSAFSTPMATGGSEIPMTPSIGIAIYPGDGESSQVLLKNAETAMFRVKQEGRNSYQFYAADMNAQAIERLRMLTLMRKGLESGEFFLHYQPQVSLNNGAITGVEALMRWNSPELGMVPPALFIPLAEETGLIHRLGDLALQQGCRQCRAWHQEGYSLRLAVNVSGIQFLQNDFLDKVQQIVQASGLPFNKVELELTESVLMHNPDESAGKLRALKALGLQLAIDDFGTGYSSLSYLKHFPLDRLKIDRSFVMDIFRDSDDRAITEAIIALSRSLRLTVIAEGVETGEQLAFIRERGCDEAQGVLFQRAFGQPGY